MKHKLQPVLILSLVTILSFVSYSQAIVNDSLYLGQTPPGNTPKIFQLPVGAGLFAAERIAISADGKEIYYSELNGYTNQTISRIKYLKYSDGMWNSPTVLFVGFIAPFFSIDGRTLFFEDNQNSTYYSVRIDNSWSTPAKYLNTSKMVHYLQVTNLGNYYLTSDPIISTTGDISDLLINGADTTIHNLGVPLNSSSNGFDFFISGDESYIIRVIKTNGLGSLYISYHKADGSWTNPKTLGTQANASQAWEWGPYVTDDNKYLFFTRQQSTTNIYWVRVDNLIDSLKHTDFVPYAKWPISSQNATTDVLFSFTIPDSTFYDDDHDPITYSATKSNGNPLPSLLSFDPLTRTFSGIPLAATSIPLSISVLATDPSNKSGSCVFSLTVSAPTGVEEGKNQLPQGFELQQNYPNPFNPSTTIQYSLAKSSFIKLNIYNLLGQKIRTLQNSFQTAGEHSLVWDATDEKNNPVVSGMFFYRLEADNLILQKKMVLVK